VGGSQGSRRGPDVTHPVVVRPEAEAELHEAYAWYEAQRTGLGDEFLQCAGASIASIQRNPRIHSVVHRTVRRALLRRFPYGLFYVVEENAVSVIAILHLSRDPDRWMRRST